MTEPELICLEDLKYEKYDQFENKKSTYDPDMYNTSINLSEITAEQMKKAEEVEREIN
jgi:hypothetical protein